jgi:hypothetical protein
VWVVLNYRPSDGRVYRRKFRIAGHQDGFGKSDGAQGLVDADGYAKRLAPYDFTAHGRSDG